MKNGLFALVPQSHIEEVLRNLQEFVELPIQLLDSEGNLLLAYGKTTDYCARLKREVFAEGACREVHKKAGMQAQAIGESYIFSCHANLNHIAFPLSGRGQLLGSVIVGPFLMDVPDSTLVSGVAEKFRIPMLTCLELYDELSGIRVISPQKATQLSRLINHLLTPLLREQTGLRENREKLYQQSRIGENIQRYKEEGMDASVFFEKESILLQKARTGNTQDVKVLLNELLGYVFFNEGGKLETVRIRAIGLTALLSQVASQGGATAENLANLNRKYEELLSKEQSYEDLCYCMQFVAEGFMAAMFETKGQENVSVRRAIQYIAAHYAENVTLAALSEEVSLSPNYFSTVFKQAMGKGYREYLTEIRLKEACHLLTETDQSMTDIAFAVGFSDQSTFCKAFRREYGVTPGQYRGNPR